jgi:hypothetical protein
VANDIVVAWIIHSERVRSCAAFTGVMLHFSRGLAPVAPWRMPRRLAPAAAAAL